MENTINLTAKEIKGLEAIIKSDFYENGRDSIVWDYSVHDICELRGKTRSGIFSSLAQKGLIIVTEKEKKYIINENGNKNINPNYNQGLNFGTYSITNLGYEIMIKMGMVDSDGYMIENLN